MPVYLRDCVGDRVPTDLFTEIVKEQSDKYLSSLKTSWICYHRRPTYDRAWCKNGVCLFLFSLVIVSFFLKYSLLDIHSRPLPKELVREKQVVKQSIMEKEGFIFPISVK